MAGFSVRRRLADYAKELLSKSKKTGSDGLVLRCWAFLRHALASPSLARCPNYLLSRPPPASPNFPPAHFWLSPAVATPSRRRSTARVPSPHPPALSPRPAKTSLPPFSRPPPASFPPLGAQASRLRPLTSSSRCPPGPSGPRPSGPVVPRPRPPPASSARQRAPFLPFLFFCAKQSSPSPPWVPSSLSARQRAPLVTRHPSLVTCASARHAGGRSAQKKGGPGRRMGGVSAGGLPR